jgi:hypothetical protein
MKTIVFTCYALAHIIVVNNGRQSIWLAALWGEKAVIIFTQVG